MATITLTPADILPPPTSTTVTFNSFLITAGEDIEAGDFVYKATADGFYYLSDNSTAEKSTICGMAANNAFAGQHFTLIQKDSTLPIGTGVIVPGRLYGLSSTPGKMCDIVDVATTGAIYLIIAAQANSDSETIRFNFLAPVAGILND